MTDHPPVGRPTFYDEDADALAEVLAEAPVDHESLRRPLRPCAVGCAATCCHDGAWLSEAAAVRLDALTERFGDALRALGAPDPRVVPDPDGGHRTARVPAPPHPSAPPWFPPTRCGFLTADRACALQRLGEALGQHPWTFKPVACVLHPLSTDRAGEAVIWLPTAATDPHRDGPYLGFAAHTPCGAEGADGPPAAEVLAAELAWLGALIGRPGLAGGG